MEHPRTAPLRHAMAPNQWIKWCIYIYNPKKSIVILKLTLF